MSKVHPLPQLPLQFRRLEESDMLETARQFYKTMDKRRSVRDFSPDPVPQAIIESCIAAAGTAPSGANRQPWHFAVVKDPAVKKEIREGAEEEEREFYEQRAPQEWLDALAPIGTDANKPFLETAPYLIVVFAQKFSSDEDGEKLKNYYTTESVGIATGLLIAALHQAGLGTLTHTPSPMKFLNSILGRPQTERPLMILVAGYPAQDATVPDITRKPVSDIYTII